MVARYPTLLSVNAHTMCSLWEVSQDNRLPSENISYRKKVEWYAHVHLDVNLSRLVIVPHGDHGRHLAVPILSSVLCPN